MTDSPESAENENVSSESEGRFEMSPEDLELCDPDAQPTSEPSGDDVDELSEAENPEKTSGGFNAEGGSHGLRQFLKAHSGAMPKEDDAESAVRPPSKPTDSGAESPQNVRPHAETSVTPKPENLVEAKKLDNTDKIVHKEFIPLKTETSSKPEEDTDSANTASDLNGIWIRRFLNGNGR